MKSTPKIIITTLILSLINIQILAAPCDKKNKAKNLIHLCNKNQQQCQLSLLNKNLGNYQVQLSFSQAYQGKIFAESRRLMFEASHENNPECIALTINVRDPEGEPLKAKQAKQPPALDIYFNQTIKYLTGIYIKAAPSVPQLFIAGDSTVCDQAPQFNKPPEERYSGWGQFLPKYFNSDIAVVNYADSGEGTAAFSVEGGELWQAIYPQLRAGDWVFIQLGHNDKTTPAATYTQRLQNMIRAIKQRGATPVLISPMIRNTNTPLAAQHTWPELNVRLTLLQVANSEQVAFIDLMQLSSKWANKLGQANAQSYFVKNDRTHTNEKGAALFAAMLVKAIQGQNLGLVQFLR